MVAQWRNWGGANGCFLMKAVCIYFKNLKESRHELFLNYHSPQK